jgi:hypothetical protein
MVSTRIGSLKSVPVSSCPSTVSEKESTNIPKLATELEDALFVRWQELAHDATPTTERVAIQKAVRPQSAAVLSSPSPCSI